MLSVVVVTVLLFRCYDSRRPILTSRRSSAA